MTNEEAAKMLRQIADQLEAAFPAKAEESKAEPAKPTATLEEVRAVLTRLSAEKGAARVKDLLATFNAKKLSDIPADQYAYLKATAETSL